MNKGDLVIFKDVVYGEFRQARFVSYESEVYCNIAVHTFLGWVQLRLPRNKVFKIKKLNEEA